MPDAHGTPRWPDHWRREADVHFEPGISYLVTLDEVGVRWIAPLGTSYPDGLVVEEVRR